jgi:spore germination protein YaaH
MLTDDVTASAYLQSRYQHWSGAYDYKALADSSDFITLMMYDQHGSITPPGPMASMPWSEAILRYALAYIPVEKISLGIPLHSGYWYTGKQNGSSIHMIATDLTFPEAMTLLRNNHATLHWDKNAQVPYTFFIRHELYQYVFAENAASFQAKIALVKKYHLRGVSLWCLGEEDPKIWHILAQRKKFK